MGGRSPIGPRRMSPPSPPMSRCLPRLELSEDIHGPQRLTRRELNMGQWGDCTHSVTPSVNRMRPSTDTEESPCSVNVTSFRPPVALSKRRRRARSQQPSLARWPFPRCHSILSLHLRRKLGTTPVLWRERSTRRNPTPTSQTLNRRQGKVVKPSICIQSFRPRAQFTPMEGGLTFARRSRPRQCSAKGDARHAEPRTFNGPS